MNNRIMGVFLVAGLVAILAAIGPSSAGANSHSAPTSLYFPWVPSGAMLDGSGPYNGVITVQNLEEQPITLYAVSLRQSGTGEPPTVQTHLLNIFETISLSPQQLGISENLDGAGVHVYGERASDGAPARIAGVQVQAQPVPPRADGTTGSEHMTAGGYTALTVRDIGTDVVLPIAQSNSGWNTHIRVTNFAESGNATPVTATFYVAGSGQNVGGTTESVAPGDAWSIDLSQTQLGNDWVGSVRITADVPVGAIAERVKAETSMLIINTSRHADQGQADLTRHYAPLILREWNNWNTGISVVNLGSITNPVTVNYYALDGELVDTIPLVLPPNGMDFIYTPSVQGETAAEQGFVGAAVIDATYPVHAVVDEVKYFGDDEDTGHAMSYMTDPRATVRHDFMVMPMVHRGSLETGLGNTTGIQLFNPDNSTPAKAKIWFFSADGQRVPSTPERLTIDPLNGHTAYSLAYDYLPVGFTGSAIIHVTDGRLVAAANNVNYGVGMDGSASMNLLNARWLLNPYEMELEATLNPVPHFQDGSMVTATITDRFGEPYRDNGRSVWFETNNPGQTGFHDQPAPSNDSLVTGNTDEQGKVTFEIQIRDDALNERPVEAVVTVGAAGLEGQVTVVWSAPPSVQGPSFQ